MSEVAVGPVHDPRGERDVEPGRSVYRGSRTGHRRPHYHHRRLHRHPVSTGYEFRQGVQ